MASLHPDGTAGLEGTRSVPGDWTPCCDSLAGHVETCAYDIRYEFWPGANQWVIAIAESAGGGGIGIGWVPTSRNATAGTSGRAGRMS